MKKFLSSILISLAAVVLSAQEMTVTIEQAVTLALQNNLQVKQAERSLGALERSDKYSWNSVSPSISGSANLQLPLMDNAYGQRTPSYSLGASMSLRLTPSLYTTIKNAKLQLEQGKITYDDALRSVELNVRKIFYSLILAEENLNVQKRTMDAAQRQYETNKAKYNRGQLSELDLLQSQVSYESKKPAIESQENQLINSLENFKQLLGIDKNINLQVQGTIEGFENFDESKVTVDFSNISSIRKLEKQIETAENQLMATRFSAWGPSISASYSVGAGGQIKEGSELKLSNHSISLGLSIPLDGYLPWSAGSLSIQSQKENLETLRENLKTQKTSTELAVENSLRSIRQAKSQMKSLESTVELSQKSYDLTANAYNHGSRDLSALKNAEDSLLSAKVQLQSQNYNLVNAILELESTLGIPFGTLSR